MDNPRPEKVAVVDEVRERLTSSGAAILTEYRGLKVAEMAALRRSLREAGGDYVVYKNTLVRFAVNDLGLGELEPLLHGPTAIAFVDGDAASVAKALRDFGRTNPALVVKGGVLGERVISAADAAALADLPSREELLARLAGGLAAPLRQLAGLMAALPRNFAYGLKALIDKNGGVPEAAAEAAPSAETAPAEEPQAPAAEAAPTAEAEAPAAVAEAPAEPQAEQSEPEGAAAEEAPATPDAEAAPAEAADTESQEEQ